MGGVTLARGCEGAQPEELTQIDQRHVPYHITSRSAIKLSGGSFPKVAIAQRRDGHRSASGR